jgi:hypothetical protein
MKKSELKEYIKEMIITELTTVTPKTENPEIDLIAKKEKVDVPVVKQAVDDAKRTGKPVNVAEAEEDDDFEEKEPTTADIAANSSIAKLQSKYSEVVKQMKSVVNKYKSAEGSEKTKYVDQLKNLTKLKKEIEAMINPSVDDEEI